ncbi:MAG: hypothetical protein WDN29_04215 [Methylovirgula sp.]
MKPFELNDGWLSELTRLTRRKDGPRRARDLLAEHGIALVIERHLPGTYLDGAAMLSAFSSRWWRSPSAMIGSTISGSCSFTSWRTSSCT